MSLLIISGSRRLVNCERNITESLKEYEEKVAGGLKRGALMLEFSLFEKIRGQIALENHRIKETASGIGEIDVLGRSC